MLAELSLAKGIEPYTLTFTQTLTLTLTRTVILTLQIPKAGLVVRSKLRDLPFV